MTMIASNLFISSDLSIFLAITILSLGYSALAHYNYSFLHFLLIFEIMVIAVCLLFVCGTTVIGSANGEVAVLFIIAIVAAETALAVAMYIRTSISPPAHQPVSYKFSKPRVSYSFKKSSKHNLLGLDATYTWFAIIWCKNELPSTPHFRLRKLLIKVKQPNKTNVF